MERTEQAFSQAPKLTRLRIKRSSPRSTACGPVCGSRDPRHKWLAKREASLTPSTENHPVTRRGTRAAPSPATLLLARERPEILHHLFEQRAHREKHATLSRTASVSVTENAAAKSGGHD